MTPPTLRRASAGVFALVALCGLGVSTSRSAEAEATPSAPVAVAPPQAADITAVAVHPQEVKLRTMDEAVQLIVTATLKDGRQQDLTGDSQFAVVDGKTAKVTNSGRVVVLASGASAISVTFAGKNVQVPVKVDAHDANLPMNFTNQMIPIFTKMSCNSGGCHGKASGQNGFKLSLLGFDPEFDYASVVKESRGRRLMPEAPDHSLFLRKAVGAVPHGGGKKMDAKSDEYKLVRRWIANGMPFGKASDPVVTKITIFPQSRIMTRQNKQQIAVYAHYSDNSVEDITRRAQYDSNDQEIAGVDTNGLVVTKNLSGEAAIMARYQGFVEAFRATVPLGGKTPDWNFPEQTFVDRFTSKKWKELGLMPSELCNDEHFIRRATLDICGTLPTPEEVNAFVTNADPKKRDQLVDRLVDRPEYAYYFANKWADILRVKRGREGNSSERAMGTFAFHGWIKEAMATDKPYNEFVRDILSASGDELRNPPTVWYKDLQSPEQFVDDTAQVFLGLRIACAQCHHHPYEKWGQDDYWGLAAFFGRVGKKQQPIPGGIANQQSQMQVVFSRSSGGVTNKRTGQPAKIKPLDGEAIELTGDDDPRQKLADWMVDPKNPFFAKAVANRYWAHFFGRGIVDPLDDMRVTNPPSNPELLDGLAKSLVDGGYSLKGLVKSICKSRTYQLSAIPNEFNQHDKQAYARYYPKRLAAEVLLDALCQVTDSPAGFGGLPADRFAPKRAIMLPDESFTSYFLDVFGRPQRISSCECERVSEANLAQALHLLNSEEIQNKLTRGGGRVDQLTQAKDARSDEQKVTEMFQWVYARKPSATDLSTALDHIRKNEKNKKVAYENILWALLNTKEFLFNQ